MVPPAADVAERKRVAHNRPDVASPQHFEVFLMVARVVVDSEGAGSNGKVSHWYCR